MNKDNPIRRSKEEIAIFTTQLVVHMFGVVATAILARIS
jgi:hypothetical protein